MKLHSSQALAIDVFGTLQQSLARDAILGSLAESLSLPTVGPWALDLEWAVPFEVLGEPTPSQIDVRAISPEALILFECKFTEREAGCCSQPLPLRRGPHHGDRQCDGNYRRQRNPANGREASCALSGKGIRYWEFIPAVFGFSSERDYGPCPFAGPSFQWMRNLTACYAYARSHHLTPGFVLVYADAPELPVARHVASGAWSHFTRELRPETIAVTARSAQQIVADARAATRLVGGCN